MTLHEAYGTKGWGKVTVRAMIRAGLISDRTEEQQLKQEAEWREYRAQRDLYKQHRKAVRTAERIKEISKMIRSTAERLIQLRAERDRLQKTLNKC